MNPDVVGSDIIPHRNGVFILRGYFAASADYLPRMKVQRAVVRLTQYNTPRPSSLDDGGAKLCRAARVEQAGESPYKYYVEMELPARIGSRD